MSASRRPPCISRPLLAVVLIAALLLPCGGAAADATPIDLGYLGNAYAGANGINDLGQVVGLSATADWDAHGFLWQDGTMTELAFTPYATTIATAINNRGQVIGFAYLEDGTHAWLWENGLFTELTPFPDGYDCSAYAINDAGAVVGECWVGSGQTHAFLWQNGTMIDLWTLGCPFGGVVDINARGDILGGAEGGPALCTRRGLTRLCFLEGDCGSAAAMNDRGQIVGVAGGHAVLWNRGVVTDLGTLGGGYSRAADINNRGEVVGYSTTGTPDLPMPMHAFVWDGTMHDLGFVGEGWNMFESSATAINRSGDIVGWSIDQYTYQQSAVLWPAQDR